METDAVYSSVQKSIWSEKVLHRFYYKLVCGNYAARSMCRTTTDEMELHFKKDIVEIVSVRYKCNKTHRKSVFSKWRWLSGNQIKVEKLNYENQPFISGNILYAQNNQLIGKTWFRIHSGFHI